MPTISLQPSSGDGNGRPIGYTVDADTQEGIVGLVMAIVGGVGGLVAIYGRVKAKKKIG